MKAKGIIMGYRRGTNTQYTSQVLVKLLIDDPRKAGLFLAGKAVYRDAKGNVYKGRVLRLHGRKNGVVVVRFTPNLPGQAIGGIVEIFKK
jgi:large subunit ribosomal protein L35Ae